MVTDLPAWKIVELRERGLRPPPPPPLPKRLPLELRKAPSERITAEQLRAGDLLVTTEGLLHCRDIHQLADRTRILSNACWWSVPTTVRFRRIRRPSK